jgi:hypothetical protein
MADAAHLGTVIERPPFRPAAMAGEALRLLPFPQETQYFFALYTQGAD